MEQIQKTSLQNSLSTEEVKVKHCQFCNSNHKQLLRCARCKKVYYCNAECQKSHWPTHKINCNKPKQSCNPESSKTMKTKSSITVDESTDCKESFHALDDFGKLTHLGSGNFSEIFKAVNKKDGKTYAIKQVEKIKVQRVRKQADLFMEKHCLSKLKDCPYVIKLYRTFQDEANLFIQMECPEKGQLWEQCRTFGFFSEVQFKYYASHLVKAMSIVHNDYDIVHRDLKPENILLNDKNEIKLIDFGTAKDLSRPDIKGSGNGLKGKKPFEHYVGTPNYMAPECIHNKASQKKSDIYSLSGIFYFMKVGGPPFTGGSEYIVFQKSLETQIFCCPELFSPQLKDLLRKMNAKDLEKRIDINQVMKHEYFNDVDFDNLDSYQQIRDKITKAEFYLKQKTSQIFEKYQKIGLEGTSEQRVAAYDKQISPLLDSLIKDIDFEVQQQDRKCIQERVNIIKIQVKAMLNYHQDNSVGFTEIYNKDWDLADRLINQVRQKKTQAKKQQVKDGAGNKQQEQAQQDTQTQQVVMKKVEE